MNTTNGMQFPPKTGDTISFYDPKVMQQITCLKSDTSKFSSGSSDDIDTNVYTCDASASI
jgi:hypothetical protein